MITKITIDYSYSYCCIYTIFNFSDMKLYFRSIIHNQYRKAIPKKKPKKYLSLDENRKNILI